MKVNILNGWEVGMVDVPEGATNFRVAKAHNDMRCLFHSKGFKLLSYVDWSILGPGTASQCSEEEAKGIVEMFNNPFAKYCHGKYYRYDRGTLTYTVGDSFVGTALESLHSYIRANGKEPDRVVIIVKNIKG